MRPCNPFHVRRNRYFLLLSSWFWRGLQVALLLVVVRYLIGQDPLLFTQAGRAVTAAAKQGNRTSGALKLAFPAAAVARQGSPHVLILSYWGAGGGLLGKMFDFHPRPRAARGLYWYEPLTSLYRAHYKQHTKEVLPFDSGYFMKSEQSAGNPLWNRTTALLQDIFSCHVARLASDSGMVSRFVKDTTLSLTLSKAIRTCVLSYPNATKRQRSELCGQALVTSCQKARHRAVKTSDLSLSLAATLLDRDPKVKVIHVVRDPRGVLSSRERYRVGHIHDEAELRSRSRQLCAMMDEDLRAANRLQVRYGRSPRHLTVRYEDLAFRPVETGKRVLGFVGLKLPHALQKWLVEVTSPQPDSPLSSSSLSFNLRKNAAVQAAAWRHHLSPAWRDVITKVCMGTMRRLGYDVQLTTSLGNTTMSDKVSENNRTIAPGYSTTKSSQLTNPPVNKTDNLTLPRANNPKIYHNATNTQRNLQPEP